VSIRLLLLPILVLANCFAWYSLSRGIAHWVGPQHRRQVARVVGVIVFLLNLPLLIFYVPPADALLGMVPPNLLLSLFYPSAAWMATLIVVLAIAILLAIPAAIWSACRGLAGRTRERRPLASAGAEPPPQKPPEATDASRRNFLAQSPGLVVAGIYGAASIGIYSRRDEIDVSSELAVPIPHLPRSFDGLSVVQLSDLHVGPYVREKELQHVVDLTNELHPELIVITGDVLDRHLSSLPDAVNGLKGLRAPLGVFAVLGNHDFYADRYSRSALFRGGVRIAKGLDSIGIRTLRNETVQLGTNADRLALLGLDWFTSSPEDGSFQSYKPIETRRQLRRMMDQSEPETARILLSHHPDTFKDVPSEIGLTLSGHTHGGGQVVLGHINNVPIGVATLQFKYLSGLYQKDGSSLYVNRGIGYLGIPIRINCPPEISRFRLIRPAASAS
jgi:uncharacterized protein